MIRIICPDPIPTATCRLQTITMRMVTTTDIPDMGVMQCLRAAWASPV